MPEPPQLRQRARGVRAERGAASPTPAAPVGKVGPPHATAEAGGCSCCWLVLCAAALLASAVAVAAALVALGLVEKQTQQALYSRPVALNIAVILT